MARASNALPFSEQVKLVVEIRPAVPEIAGNAPLICQVVNMIGVFDLDLGTQLVRGSERFFTILGVAASVFLIFAGIIIFIGLRSKARRSAG